MAWNTAEFKAIGNYAKERDLRLELSTRPFVHFVDRDGKKIKMRIAQLMNEYVKSQKEEAHEKSRRQKEEAHRKRKYSWQK
jgi:hypothetical protein